MFTLHEITFRRKVMACKGFIFYDMQLKVSKGHYLKVFIFQKFYDAQKICNSQ